MAKKPVKPVKAAPRPASMVQPTNLSPFWSNFVLHCWLIMAFGTLLYVNTLTYDYTQDDAIVIYENMFTTKGLNGIPGILKYDTFYGFFKEAGKSQLVSGGRYRPLTLVLFAIEYELFGKSPLVGHLTNVLLYAFTGVMLYLLLVRVLRQRWGTQHAQIIGLLTSLLFLAHPVHTEAVANIKGLDEILALLGSLGAVYFSWRGFEENKFQWNLVAGVIFFLALLSKENAITFVAITPLIYWFFSKANNGKIVSQTIPFAVAAGVFLVLRTAVIGFQFVSQPMELMNNPFLKLVNNQYVPFSAGEKMATIMYTLGRYVQLLIFPYPLTHDYYPRAVDIMQWGDWRVLLSLVIYGGLIFWAIKNWKNKSLVVFGILFYLLTLSIVSNIVFPVGTNMGERFIFMPSLGFCLVVAYGLWYWATQNGKTVLPARLTSMLAISGVVLVGFGIRTVVRNTVWKDNFTLFKNDIQYSSNSAKLLNSLGGELSEKASKETDIPKQQAMLNEAIGYLNKAVQIHPGYKNAHLLLGNSYLYLKDYENSINSYQNALRLDANYKDALGNIAIAYREAGKYYGETMHDVGKAITNLNEAYKRNPNDFETLRLMGVAYGVLATMQNNREYAVMAINFFTKAIAIDPNNANALYDLGTAYANTGDAAKAEEFHQKAIKIYPNLEKERGIKK